MKKIFKLLLVCLMVITLTACKEKVEEPKVIEWEKDNKFSDVLTYHIESIKQTDKINPDVVDITYNYLQPSKEGNVLLDMTLWITNLQDSDIKLSDKFKASYLINDTEYIAALAVVSDDGKTLNQDGTIIAKGYNKVHLYAEINPKQLDKKIEFRVLENGDMIYASMNLKLSNITKYYENKNLNEVLSFESRSDIVPQSINITKEIKPANPTGLYNFYKVQQDTDSFVVLTTQVNNTSANSLSAPLVATAYLIDQNGDNYPAILFYENDSHSDITKGSDITIEANASKVVYYAFELPDEIVNGTKIVRFSYGGKVYSINI